MKILSPTTIVTFLCVFQYILCREGVSYKYQRVGCNKFNKKFLYNVTCHVRHVNRTSQLLNWKGYIQPNISISNIRVQVTSYYKFTTQYRQSLINYSEYICDFLNNGTFSHLFDALKELYANYSNFLDPCPKSGPLYIRNLPIATAKFPQFLPVGEYRLDLKFFTYMNGKEEFIILNQDYVEVKALGIQQF